MKKFYVSGQARKVGAIGIFSPIQYVEFAVDADSAKEQARTKAYESGWEHVHLFAKEAP